MDLSLFTSQLNLILQAHSSPDHLDEVCELLRSFTHATVIVEAANGRVVLEKLADGEPLVNSPTLLKASILTLRRANEFTEDEKIAANIISGICLIFLRHREGVFLAEKKRRAEAVRTIINSLSFSELEVITNILQTLKENESGKLEGLLIAGHIADKLGFARSVVTSALRKLEGANLIETHSLGMKGTYIRVKDLLLSEELAKL